MASVDTSKLPGWSDSKDVTTALAAGSLTITKAEVYKFGTDVVFQLTYSDASKGYIKVKGTSRVKVGGTDNTFGTGTEITWQS